MTWRTVLMDDIAFAIILSDCDEDAIVMACWLANTAPRRIGKPRTKQRGFPFGELRCRVATQREVSLFVPTTNWQGAHFVGCLTRTL